MRRAALAEDALHQASLARRPARQLGGRDRRQRRASPSVRRAAGRGRASGAAGTSSLPERISLLATPRGAARRRQSAPRRPRSRRARGPGAGRCWERRRNRRARARTRAPRAATSPAASASSASGCSPRKASVKCSCSFSGEPDPSPPAFRAASSAGRSRSFTSSGSGNEKKRRTRGHCYAPSHSDVRDGFFPLLQPLIIFDSLPLARALLHGAHASQKQASDPGSAVAAPAGGAPALGRDVARRGVRRGLRRAQHQHRRDARRGQRSRARSPASVTGVGVRVIRGAQVGYAYSDDLDEPALLRTAQTAALIADGNREPGPVNMSRDAAADLLPGAHPARLRRRRAQGRARCSSADAAARALRQARQAGDGRRTPTRRSEILVANTAGPPRRGHARTSAASPSSASPFGKKGERRTGFYGGGGRVDFRFFDNFTPEQVGKEAARQAIATLGAVRRQAGPQTVVLAPGMERHPPARGRRARARGRLHPQGHFAVRGQARREGRAASW